MKFSPRLFQIPVLLGVSIWVGFHFWDHIWALSADLPHHYALVSRLTEFGNQLPPLDPSLGEMQTYPRLSHQLAAALGRIGGSPLIGMQAVALSSMIVAWAAIGWMLWFLPRNQARAATLSIIVMLLVGGLLLHLDFLGSEIVGNYFYAQFVAQAAALLAVSIALTLVQANVSRYIGYTALLAGIYVVERIHLLPAVELLGFLGLLVIVDYFDLKPHKPFGLVVSLAFPVAGIIIVVCNPVFRTMAVISENNGTLAIPYVPGFKSLALLVFASALVSFWCVRYWARATAADGRRDRQVFKYLGLVGLSIAVLCTLQIAMLAVGKGSEYACKKYAFGLLTVFVINLSLILVSRFSADLHLGEKGVRRVVGSAFDCSAVGVLVGVAALANFPSSSPFSMSGLISMERRLDVIKKSPEIFESREAVYAIKLPGQPSLIDYMFSVGLFKAPRTINTLDILYNRNLSWTHRIGYIVTGKGASKYDIQACRRPSVDSQLAVIDGACYQRSIPDNSYCHGDMDLASSTTMTGFSRPEEGGVWTNGNSAVFRCDIAPDAASHPYAVRISASGFVTGSHVQHVGISLNGNVTRQILFDTSKSRQSITLPVPAEARAIQIEFFLPDAISPKAAGVSADVRQLALYVESIQFLTKDGELM